MIAANVPQELLKEHGRWRSGAIDACLQFPSAAEDHESRNSLRQWSKGFLDNCSLSFTGVEDTLPPPSPSLLWHWRLRKGPTWKRSAGRCGAPTQTGSKRSKARKCTAASDHPALFFWSAMHCQRMRMTLAPDTFT